jgi:hypothetical protein
VEALAEPAASLLLSACSAVNLLFGIGIGTRTTGDHRAHRGKAVRPSVDLCVLCVLCGEFLWVRKERIHRRERRERRD